MTYSTETTTLSREQRTELLAAAPPEPLVALADACLASAGWPAIIRPPEVGMVMLTVREPVEHTRFHLAEVLVTQAELEHRGQRGWSMRLGDDTAAALAAAVCDAEVEASGPCAAQVEQLCRTTARRLAEERATEWAEIAPTIVAFEELDR